MRRAVGTLLGKSVAGAVRLRGRSSGQAVPGLVAQTLVPGYLAAMLKQLPKGVAIITGTNGKTTTTKMVVELLRATGLRVLTNPTGSNVTHGIVSSVVHQATPRGTLPFDIAVFEVDEAWARQLVHIVRPRFVLGLNASRDQLDRFGEVDTIARFIAETMSAATEKVVTNADDKRLRVLAERAVVPVEYFGVSPKLLQYFPRDDEIVAVQSSKVVHEAADRQLSVELVSFAGDAAEYRIGSKTYKAKLQVTGQHNFQNAAAALAFVGAITNWEGSPSKLIAALEKVRPAFGRGQEFTLRNGSKLQLNLVKNPASFRQGLASYVRTGTPLMIAINDRVADSRDLSWLWDIDFTSLQTHPITLTTGIRAVDMALRLRYDEVPVGAIEPNIEKALTMFARLPGDKVIFASYTAMLKLHALLEKTAGRDL